MRLLKDMWLSEQNQGHFPYEFSTALVSIPVPDFALKRSFNQPINFAGLAARSCDIT